MKLLADRLARYRSKAAELAWYLENLVKQKGKFTLPDDGTIELKKNADGVYTNDHPGRRS